MNQHKSQIHKALFDDFKKHPSEIDLTEISDQDFVLSKLRTALDNFDVKSIFDNFVLLCFFTKFD